MAVSRDHHEFDTSSDVWTLNKDVVIDVDDVLDLLAKPLQEPYRRVMKFYAENFAPWYCFNIHLRVRQFLEVMEVEDFPQTALRKYQAHLGRADEWKLGTIRAFLQRWHDQGYPGISKEAIAWLRSVRFQGNQKGRAVLSMDPDDGPFDDQELEAILKVAPQEYERGRIDLATLAFTLLLAYTGRRPGQLSLLRLGDLSRTVTTDGRSIDILRIPRSKQRGHAPRAQFKNFWLDPDVDRVLKVQRDIVIDKVQALLGNLAGNIGAELPLFPNWAFIRECRSVRQLEFASRSDMAHVPTSNMSTTLKKIRVVSLRTGRQLRIAPRRFRYTLGTRAAREGYGALVIAELLDHSDTQNAQVYTRDHPNFRRTIDEALGQQLAGLARAFAGRVVDREADARHGNDPGMRVGTLERKVGTCASSGWCGADVPLACYTCMHFEAWRDAPHDEMLERALDRREELKSAGVSEMVVNAADSSILAVRAVIDACEARQAELGGVRKCGTTQING